MTPEGRSTPAFYRTTNPTQSTVHRMSATTNATHHVQAIIDLLDTFSHLGRDLLIEPGETRTVDAGEIDRWATVQNAGTLNNQGTFVAGVDVWSGFQPEVYSYYEHAQNEKGPGADQRPTVYVWSPVDSSLDRFSVDDDQLRESNTVEVQIWSLDPQEVAVLQRDIIQILSLYLDDNKIRTPYTDIQPSSASDFREQKQARVTDHYIMSVQVDTDGLRDNSVV